MGLENVRLVETPGNPVVYGDWLARGAAHRRSCSTATTTCSRSIRWSLWESPPFEATDTRRRDLCPRRGRRQGPGVHAPQGDRGPPEEEPAALPLNIRLVIEGEEEVGSGNLDEFIRANKSQLAADVVVISDSAMFDRGVPSICYSLRGLAYFQIDLRGTKSDLHSGVFGGAVANPGHGARADSGADEGSRRPDQDSRVLRRRPADFGGRARGVAAAAVQREEIPQGSRRAEACRRERVLGARARLGPADIRSQRTAQRLHRRGREDRHSRRRDGQGQHAARARSASRQDRDALRGVRHERSRQRLSS